MSLSWTRKITASTTDESLESAKLKEAEANTGTLMVEAGYLSEKQIQLVLAEQFATGGRFGEVALKLGLVTEKQICKILAKQARVKYYDLRSCMIDRDIAYLLNAENSLRYEFLPLKALQNNTILVGITEPNNLVKKDMARKLISPKLEFVAVESSELALLQARIYDELDYARQIKAFAAEYREAHMKNQSGTGAIKSLIPKIVNALIWDALVFRASDIHLAYTGEVVRVFYRQNGELQYRFALPAELYLKIAAQIKQASGLEPGDKLHTGDGNWSFQAGIQKINLRVSKMPTIPFQEGESLVLRILDKNRVSLDLQALGFYPEDVEQLTELCQQPYGMILCTGPTGSGKTTSLYSMLSVLNPFEKNILTAEDPVEYAMPGIRQVQINPLAKITFASALRAFLRQDPDVILVGEIRDAETAEIAIHSALTGHLVLSTLHTNDAVSALPRMAEFKLSENSIRTSLLCIIAQRLVRKLCPNCKVSRKITQAERTFFQNANLDAPERVYEPGDSQQCKLCSNGFISPTVIYEILVVTDQLREQLTGKASHEITQLAITSGMVPILQNGLRKVADGLTTIDEVIKAARS